MGVILSWIVIGLVVGVVTGKVMGAGNNELLITIITGIAGAFVAGFAMSRFGSGFMSGPIVEIVVTVIGAALFTAVYLAAKPRT